MNSINRSKRLKNLVSTKLDRCLEHRPVGVWAGGGGGGGGLQFLTFFGQNADSGKRTREITKVVMDRLPGYFL